METNNQWIVLAVLCIIVVLILLCGCAFALYTWSDSGGMDVSCDCGHDDDIPTKTEILEILDDFASRNMRKSEKDESIPQKKGNRRGDTTTHGRQRGSQQNVSGVSDVYFNPFASHPSVF